MVRYLILWFGILNKNKEIKCERWKVEGNDWVDELYDDLIGFDIILAKWIEWK